MEGNINITSINFNKISILKHNNYLRINNIKIDRTLSNTSIYNFKKKYYSNKTTRILILENDNKREVILIGDKNILITYDNNNMFDNLFLPEIINLYLRNKEITKELSKEYYNRHYLCINDNLYIMNYNEIIMSGTKEYIHSINNNNIYKIELNKDYEKEESTINVNNYKRVYSYGYINILLVAFIISIITIIFCLFKF